MAKPQPAASGGQRVKVCAVRFDEHEYEEIIRAAKERSLLPATWLRMVAVAAARAEEEERR